MWQINERATRGARIKLDVEADSPIVLIPESSRTDRVLVADLGHLRLTNRFVLDGHSGTLSFDDAQACGRGEAGPARPRRASRETGQPRSRHPSGGGGGGGARSVRDMTESVFEHSYPPVPHDPMTSSVYGSLDEDARFEGPEESELDFLLSPERGSSVDPSSPEAKAGGRRGPSGDPQPSPSSHGSAAGSVPTPSSSGGEQGDVGGGGGGGEARAGGAGGAGAAHRCLLDVMDVVLRDIDLLTATRVAKRDYRGRDHASDMEFTSYVVQIEVSLEHLLRRADRGELGAPPTSCRSR